MRKFETETLADLVTGVLPPECSSRGELAVNCHSSLVGSSPLQRQHSRYLFRQRLRFRGFWLKKGVFSGEARTVKVALFGSAGFLGVAFSKDPVRFPRRGESRLKQCWYKVCTLGRLLWEAKSATVDLIG